jgi:site-specific DNA-methyltransferase (adenine-specific)
MIAEPIITWDCAHLPLPANSVDLIITDPPYTEIHLYAALAREAARVLRPGGFLLTWLGTPSLPKIITHLEDSGLTYYYLYNLHMNNNNRSGIVWKSATRGGRGSRHNKPVIIRTKHILAYSKGRAVSRVATIDTVTADLPDKRWHPWGQPVATYRLFIDQFSKPGDTIVDPFCGAGTAAAAAQILDRQWIIGDIDPATCTLAQTRIHQPDAWLQRYPLFHQLQEATL